MKWLAKEMIQNPKSEHTLNWLKALVAWIPVVWWSINSLMSDYLPDYKYNRLEKFLEDLSKEFENFKWEHNEEYITSEEFWYVFEETMKNVTWEYRTEKLEAYKNFLVNCIVDQSIDSSKKEYVLWIIEKLNYIHIIIFQVFYSPDEIIEKHSISFTGINTGLWSNLESTFKKLISPFDIPQHIWENAIKEMEQMWIIKEILSNFRTMSSRSDISSIKEKQSIFWKEVYSFIKNTV